LRRSSDTLEWILEKHFTKLMIIVAVAGTGFVLLALFLPPGEASGWWQVAIAIVGLPLLIYQLYQIRKAIEQKPRISIGLANVEDLPTSEIRSLETLHTTVTVNRGYAHFYLVVRNQGTAAAKFVKIHLEYKPEFRHPEQAGLVPVIDVSEFSGGKPSFYKENNAEFVYIGGSDWTIHPNDTEVFAFHITTVLVLQKEPFELREFPEPGNYHFHCTVWAERLDHPISEQLIVKIAEGPGATRILEKTRRKSA
jgi:hypothetical protein